MIWWFLILACGGGAALWAALALFIYVRRQLTEAASKESPESE
jgi:hypothetical protein